MSVPLTARQLEHEAELAAALPKQPAVIQFVVRWAAGKILEEREACAKLAEDRLLWVHGDSCYEEIAAAIRARP